MKLEGVQLLEKNQTTITAGRYVADCPCARQPRNLAKLAMYNDNACDALLVY